VTPVIVFTIGHADRDVQEESWPMYWVRKARAGRADVRWGRTLALSSIIDCRRVGREGHPGERDHEPDPRAAALVDPVGPNRGNLRHLPLSQRTIRGSTVARQLVPAVVPCRAPSC